MSHNGMVPPDSIEYDPLLGSRWQRCIGLATWACKCSYKRTLDSEEEEESRVHAQLKCSQALRIPHQEKRDLEIPLNFLSISKKREISGKCGNSQEISGNNCKFLTRLGNCSTFFQYATYICLITLCYLQFCILT